MDSKKKIGFWKIIGLIALIVLIGFFITFYVSFFGNPVMKIIARSELKQYLAENYSERTDFELGEVTYNFKDGRYHAEVQSIKSPDTRFYVSWKRGDEVRDDYEDMVSSGQNTLARLQQEARKDIAAKLRELGEANVFVIMESFDEMPHFELDIPYRPGLIDTSNLHIELYCEEHTAEVAAEVIPKIFLILEDVGAPLKELQLTLVKADYVKRYEVRNITPEDAMAKDLLSRLKELENSFKANPDAAYQSEELSVILPE